MVFSGENMFLFIHYYIVNEVFKPTCTVTLVTLVLKYLISQVYSQLSIVVLSNDYHGIMELLLGLATTGHWDVVGYTTGKLTTQLILATSKYGISNLG